MTRGLKAFLRRRLRSSGWSLHRWPLNRFDAMQDALLMLRAAGYAPRVVIDVGANVGTWTVLAVEVFAAPTYHLVEPQAACHAALARFSPPRFIVHKLALTGPGHATVVMAGGGVNGSTGAFVSASSSGSDAVTYPAATLDAVFGDRIAPTDRALLKLDVEGHELAILRPSTTVLAAVEVVVLEFQAFEIEGNGLPVFADVVAFMRERGFAFYDVAALAARPRDRRLRMGDLIFVREDSPLYADKHWA